MFKKLVTFLIIASALVVTQMPMSADVVAAEQEKKKRPTRLVGPTVGKKVQKAFEAYSADDIDGALALLLDIDASKGYDQAYVARFIAIMYATKGDNEAKAIQYLKEAIEPDLLNENDHGEAIKLLADLQMQTKDYNAALKNYASWMDFTGKEDANTFVKMAQAYYELKQLDKMIKPADNAIRVFGDKQNQNPYILKITSYYERKQYKEAIGVLETVLQLFPENKQWWTQLGMFYMLTENYSKALATLDMAYKQGFLEKESEIKTLVNLYQSNEVPYKAAVILEKHIDSGIVKRDDKNLVTLANAWHAAQHIGKAAEIYGEVAKLTNDAKHYRKQGMLLKQDEQFKKAIPALKKAIDLGIDKAGDINMSIGESYYYMEDYKQAYKFVKLAAEDPRSSKSAKPWLGFIKDTAQRKGVSL